MTYELSNFVRCELASDVAAGATSIDVTKPSAPWSGPPDPDGGTSILTLTDSLSDPDALEIIAYTGYTDNGDGTATLSGLTRGVEGTADQSWASGDYVVQSATADTLYGLSTPILTPSLVSPADGATGVGETPTLEAGGFHHDYGRPHNRSRFLIATDSELTNLVYDSDWVAATQKHDVPGGNLSTSTTVYWQAWYEDDVGQQVKSEVFSFATATYFTATVYGLAQVSTGGGAGSWQWVDADGNNITLATSDFDNHPVWGGIADATVDGQAMVKIPKFWFKVGTAPTGSDQAGNKCWWIGDAPFAVDGVDAEAHPAFMDGGAEVDQVYVGKYEGIDDGTNGSGNNIVGSASGVSPLADTTWTNYTQYCLNRNEANGGNAGVDGFHLFTIYEAAAYEMLALVELGTPDVQSAIASGHVDGSSAVNTGSTAAVYRGIYEAWGNVREWLEGMEIDGSHVISIWDREGNRTLVNTGVTTTSTDGWIVTTHDESGADYDLRDTFLPATVDGTEGNATYADYINASDSGEVNKPQRGGRWSFGSRAGLFCLSCYNEASNSGSGIGGRLAKV